MVAKAFLLRNLVGRQEARAGVRSAQRANVLGLGFGCVRGNKDEIGAVEQWIEDQRKET
jgi:hypothetical protein